MPLVIPTTTLTTNYTSFGGGSLYANGQLLIQNGAVDLQIDYGNNVGLVETFEVLDLSQGQYSVVKGSDLLVIGLRFRAAVASGVSSPAQTVQGSFYEPRIPNIVPVGGGAGNPFSSNLEVTDGVLVVNPANELFIGSGITLTNPSAGEAQITLSATGIQFAKHPQSGTYLEVTTTGSGPSGYGLDLVTNGGGGINLAVGGTDAELILKPSGAIEMDCDGFTMFNDTGDMIFWASNGQVTFHISAAGNHFTVDDHLGNPIFQLTG